MSQVLRRTETVRGAYLISVIMSLYNENLKLISEAIESILGQTYKDFEFIIINDNPENSDIETAVKKYIKNDNRILYEKNGSNIGLAESLNKALLLCKGEYVARMDGDDISDLHRLEKEIAYMKFHPECDVVCSGVITIDEDGKRTGKNLYRPKNDKVLMKNLKYGNPIVHPTTMIKKKTIIEINGYNELLAAQDYDLWLRILYQGGIFHYIDEELLYYRIRKKSTTISCSAVQSLSTKYIMDLRKSKKTFDKESYLYNIDKYLNDINFQRHYSVFNSFKYNHSIIEFTKLIGVIMSDDLIRQIVIKNIVFSFSSK